MVGDDAIAESYVRHLVELTGEIHYQEAIAACQPGNGVALISEPDNAFDPRAITVYSRYAKPIGYVPADSWLAGAMLDHGDSFYALISSIRQGTPTRVTLEVYLAQRGRRDPDIHDDPGNRDVEGGRD